MSDNTNCKCDKCGNILGHKVLPCPDCDNPKVGRLPPDRQGPSPIDLLNRENEQLRAENAALREQLAACSKAAPVVQPAPEGMVTCESCGEEYPVDQVQHEDVSGGGMCDKCCIASLQDRLKALSIAVMSDNAYHDKVAPEGMVMVPMEPTEAMIEAAMGRYQHRSESAARHFMDMHRENFRCDYLAMIAASEKVAGK